MRHTADPTDTAFRSRVAAFLAQNNSTHTLFDLAVAAVLRSTTPPPFPVTQESPAT
jgi:hypothetical protein